jgi:hypothetical protein
MPLCWVKGVATAIALVTEGGIQYDQAYLAWSSEDLGYDTHRRRPSPSFEGDNK